MIKVLRHTAVAAVAFSATFLLANVVERHLPTGSGSSETPHSTFADLRDTSMVDPFNLARIEPRGAPFAATGIAGQVFESRRDFAGSAPSMRLALLVDGVGRPVEGDRVALPSGSRFRLRMTCVEATQVEVRAVNPAGFVSDEPLWQGVVQGGSSAITPRLRLDDKRGIETLRVVQRSLHDGNISERSILILHD